jgi:indole-3-glycerol phosphate synthase/phosphoribosylanthranilate isomerase
MEQEPSLGGGDAVAYLNEIVAGRRRRVAAEGAELGEPVPGSRRQPLVPLAPGTAAAGGGAGAPLLICEIKRRSPSRGAIAPGLDAVEQAQRYAAAGVRAVSVLTEPDHFGGALADLIAVKEACPHLSVLRKDFLLDERDLEVSYRAGADAVLLLAACLSTDELDRLYRRALAMGMTPLVEVHDDAELAKARAVRPLLTGINSRDLTTFEVDTTLPARLRPAVDWPTTLLFESGIHCAEDAAFARSAGFDGVLVGEAVVRRPELVAELHAVLSADTDHVGHGRFWERVFAARHRLAGSGRPMIKVCGITNRADAELAVELGADVLGFILAPAPRRARTDAIRELADLPVLKVGVVVNDVSEALPLLRDGFLDALQLHGDEQPDRCYEIAFPYYKALRVGVPADLDAEGAYRCPRVLLDAYSPAARGGTGQRVADDLLARRAAAKGVRPLWLAGGMGPDNVAAVIRNHAPELIDASSRLEAEPGRKDHDKLRAFFREVEAACDRSTAPQRASETNTTGRSV